MLVHANPWQSITALSLGRQAIKSLSWKFLVIRRILSLFFKKKMLCCCSLHALSWNWHMCSMTSTNTWNLDSNSYLLAYGLFQDCAVGLLFALLPVLGGNTGPFRGIISMSKMWADLFWLYSTLILMVPRKNDCHVWLSSVILQWMLINMRKTM